MHQMGASEVELPQIDQDERWQLTQRVLQSETFRRSPRLRSFLLYVVENTLRNRIDSLSEHLIGLEVFSRPADYNPLEDSIVRSSARQLRAKLHEFFATEGAAEPKILDIPKGGYIAEFVPKIADRSNSIVEIVQLATNHGTSTRNREWMWIGSTALLAAILGLVLIQDRLPRSPGNSDSSPNLIFSVFPKPEEITIVLSDAALVTVNDHRSSVLPLKAYENGEEQNRLPLPLRAGKAGSSLFHSGRIITSFRDAAFAAEMATLGESRGYRITIRHSRVMHTRDFQSGNFIILGSTSSNPWGDLFEDDFNFQFGTDAATGLFGLRNVHPVARELPFYSSSAEQRRNGSSQARIALAWNLSGTGKVLLISGICSESSEGATEAVLSPDFLKTVKLADGDRPVTAFSRFELITEVVSVDGVVRARKLIASRFP